MTTATAECHKAILTIAPASLELVLASDPLHCSSAAQAVQANLQMHLCAVLPEQHSMVQDVFLAVLLSVNMLPCPLDRGFISAKSTCPDAWISLSGPHFVILD